MKKKILLKCVSTIVLLTCMFMLIPYSSNATILEEKLNLENSIKERAELLVEKIIGSKEMVVLVNVELEQETREEAIVDEDVYRGMGMTEEEYLPGITYSYVPSGAENGGPASASRGISIKRIDVLVTIDKMIERRIVNRIKKEVNELLGLNPIRGDIVRVEQIEFAVEKIDWTDYVKGWLGNIYLIIALLIMAIFLFGPLNSFFGDVIKEMDLKVKADTSISSTSSEVSGSGSGMGLGGSAGIKVLPNLNIESRLSRKLDKDEGVSKEKRFGFVTAANIGSLIYLLKKEPPEDIAVVCGYIPTVFASEVFASLSAQVQKQVALKLSQVKLFNEEDVVRIEKELNKKINFLLGGEDYISDLLDQVERGTQDNILSALERDNPVVAARLRKSLFFFEDIVILEKNILQRLVRETQKNEISFALALKGVSDEIRNIVMEALSEGAQAMLEEQIDLLGDIPEKRIVEEQRLIANLIRELEKNGEINIDHTKKHISEV